VTGYEDLGTLCVDIDNGVAVLSLNRPEVGNAFNAQMHDEVAEVLYRLAGDTAVAAVVLTGSGDEFCIGGDASHIRDLRPQDHEAEFLTVRRLIANLLALDKPLIGAINGSAIGVGATVALYCDIIVVAQDAQIADPHVSFGLAAGDGGAIMWALQAGLPTAKYYLMTGEPVGAQTALDLRLVNEVLPRDQVLTRAKEIADRLVDSPGQAVRGTKRILNKLASSLGDAVLDLAAEIERQCLHSEDHREAVAAHFEDRRPVWVNR
jgi:enoyl-CoA hydratase